MQGCRKIRRMKLKRKSWCRLLIWQSTLVIILQSGRDYSHISTKKNPTIENFADYLYGLGGRNLGNIVMEHAERAGLRS